MAAGCRLAPTSSTSAAPQLLETARLPCLATWAPAAAAITHAPVEMFTEPMPSPPVPTMSRTAKKGSSRQSAGWAACTANMVRQAETGCWWQECTGCTKERAVDRLQGLRASREALRHAQHTECSRLAHRHTWSGHGGPWPAWHLQCQQSHLGSHPACRVAQSHESHLQMQGTKVGCAGTVQTWSSQLTASASVGHA